MHYIYIFTPIRCPDNFCLKCLRKERNFIDGKVDFVKYILANKIIIEAQDVEKRKRENFSKA